MSGMTKHCADLLRESIQLAQSRNQQQPSAGDVLVAMLRDERRSIAKYALMESGIMLDDTGELQKPLGAASRLTFGEIDTAQLTESAISKAVLLEHHYAGPEHLLLALLDVPFLPAIEDYLEASSVTAATVERNVLAILGCKLPGRE